MDEVLRRLGLALTHTQELLVVALIMARCVTMITLTPFFGGNIVPMQVKMGLSVVLTILVWPLARSMFDASEIPFGAFPFMVLMLKEVLIGFIIGFINAHIFFVMDMAGRLIDTARGVSMSEVQDPHSKKRVTPTGDLYTQLFLLIFVAVQGHHLFLEGFFYSFERMPVTKNLAWANPSLQQLFELVIRSTADVWEISVVLATPIVAATFITDVVFGVLNRVAPQLNAYFMSMPVKAYGGIIMIFVSIDAIAVRMQDWVLWTLVKVQEVVSLLFVT